MITNAVIVEHTLGVAQNNVPFVTFTLRYNNAEKQPVAVQTLPIFLVDEKAETLQQSGMAETIVYLMMIAGVNAWERLDGQVVRIELNDEGKVTDIYHAVEDLRATIIPDEQPAAIEGEVDEADTEVLQVDN